MSRLLKVLLALLAVLAVLVIGGGLYVNSQFSSGHPGENIGIAVPEGTSTSKVATILESKHVIKSARFFRIYMKLRGGGGFQAGEYTFRLHESISSAAATLKKGPSAKFVRLTIPEGFTLKEIADRVGQLPGKSTATFLQVAQSGVVHSQFQPAGSTNLEGLLFPDTYFIDPNDTEQSILQRMVDTFDKNAAAVGVKTYDQVIVASLVESEGKVDVDRPKIAQVIYNRLAKGMPLQIDATIIYARGGVHRENGQVLNKDLQVDSPYNTYKNKGLPPTPIASPGRASLTAALSPTPGPWLYYVKFQTDGTHAFAVTGEEQNRNIADARRRGVNP